MRRPTVTPAASRATTVADGGNWVSIARKGEEGLNRPPAEGAWMNGVGIAREKASAYWEPTWTALIRRNTARNSPRFRSSKMFEKVAIRGYQRPYHQGG